MKDKGNKTSLVSLYLLVFLIIFISDDTYLFMSSGFKTLLTLKNVFICILPLFLLSSNHFGNIRTFVTFLLLLLLSSIANIEAFGFGVVLLSLIILSAFLISERYEFSVFASAFSDIVVLVCIYSLIVYLFTVILGIVDTSIIVNSAGRSIKYAYGCLIYDHYGILARLSSFFREPGVFMVYINLALLFDLFVCNKKWKAIRVALYSLSILASFSTGGLATFTTIILLGILKTKKKSYMMAGVALLFIGGMVITNDLVYAMFFNKLEGGTETLSSLGRISSLYIPFGIWTENFANFLFGCGIKNFHQEYIMIGRKLYNMIINPNGLSTNTILNSFALFGVGFGSLLLYGLYKFSNLIGKNKIEVFMVFLSMFFIFSNEHMLYSIPIYILIMYGTLSEHSFKKKMIR